MAPPRFSKIVYTDHAIQRRVVRRVSKKSIKQTIDKPDKTELEKDNDTEFTKVINGREVHVVAKPLPDQDAWLVKTTFVRGEDDPNIIVKSALTTVARLFPGIFR